MRDYLRSCSIMEVGNGVVRSRAMEMEAASLSPSKRRKVNSQLLNSPENSVSVSSDASLSSTTTNATTAFPSNGIVKELSSLLDLNSKAEDFETDHSTFDCCFSRETTPLSNVCEHSKEMKSSTEKKKRTSTTAANSHRKLSEAKTPSAAEIEEFFSAAENYQQKRFAEKYNYDIQKDMPLEGLYQWVRLKP